MTPEQKKAIALARARAKAAAADSNEKPKADMSLKGRFKDNFIGTDDGVTSWGESFGTWVNRAGDTATLGLAGDEGSAALTGLLPGRSYDSELSRYRENEAGMSTLGKVSADLTGAVAPALAGLGMVSGARTLGGAVAQGGMFGAGAGGLTGFMEGEGGLKNRLNSGLVGGLLGGSLGAAIPAGAALGRQVVRTTGGAMRNSRIGSEIADQLNVSPEAGRVLGQVVGEGNPTDMAAAVSRSGQSGMLADATPGTTGLLDMAMRRPGSGVARQRVDARASDAYYGVLDALDGGKAGPRIPPVANQAARAAGARPKINPLYQKAYSTPINYAEPAGQALEDVLRRAPKGAMRKAIETAKERMVYDGFPNEQIMARMADDGSVVFEEMPNTMAVDYIKRAFDEIAEGSKDAVTGRMSPDGQFANRVARDIRSALADAVPVYDDALKAASTDIRSRAAVQTGQKLLRPQTTVEEVADAISDATPAELRAMREGVRSQIDHTMGNVRAVASDQNIDARQAMRLFGDISSPNSKQKLQALFGDEWPQIADQLDKASSALGLRANVAANSATQPRQAAAEMVKNEIAPGALRRMEPLTTAKDVGRRVTGADDASLARLADQVQSEIADVLSRPGGADTLGMILTTLSNSPMRASAGQATQDVLTGMGFTALPTAVDKGKGLLGMITRQ
jgi:hypothetical protein